MLGYGAGFATPQVLPWNGPQVWAAQCRRYLHEHDLSDRVPRSVALTAAACGHSTPTSYNGEVQHNFISACTNAGAPEQACTAAYNCISSRLTFAQFLAADKAARGAHRGRSQHAGSNHQLRR